MSLQRLGDFLALVHMKAHKFHLLCSTNQGTAENKQNISLIPDQLLLLDLLVPGMHLYFLIDWCLMFAPMEKINNNLHKC